MRVVPPVGAAGQVPSWPPLLATRGPGGHSEPHAHHGMHLALAVEGTLRCAAAGTTVEAAGVVTAPDVEHQLDARGVEVLIVFVEPESAAGLALAAALPGPVGTLTAEARDRLVAHADPLALMRDQGVGWTALAVELLGGPRLPERRLHPGVRRVLAHLRRAGTDGADLAGEASLAALAEVARLSPGRLMHVFTESVGVPLRPYLAWLKLQRAAAAIASGRSITDAAQVAGFADSSHLTRSFVRMLGVRPRELQAAIRQHNAAS